MLSESHPERNFQSHLISLAPSDLEMSQGHLSLRHGRCLQSENRWISEVFRKSPNSRFVARVASCCFHIASFHSCEIFYEVIAQPWAIPKLSTCPPYTHHCLVQKPSCLPDVYVPCWTMTAPKSKTPGWLMRWKPQRVTNNFWNPWKYVYIYKIYNMLFTRILKLVFSCYNLLDIKWYLHNINI